MDRAKIAKLLAMLADPATTENERQSARKAVEKLLDSAPAGDTDRWADLAALARAAAEAMTAGAVSAGERALRDRLAAWGRQAAKPNQRDVQTKPVERMTRQELVDLILVGGYPVDVEGDTPDDVQPAIVIVLTLPDDVADALADRATGEAKIASALGTVLLDAINRGLRNEATWGDLPFDPDADVEDDDED